MLLVTAWGEVICANELICVTLRERDMFANLTLGWEDFEEDTWRRLAGFKEDLSPCMPLDDTWSRLESMDLADEAELVFVLPNDGTAGFFLGPGVNPS